VCFTAFSQLNSALPPPLLRCCLSKQILQQVWTLSSCSAGPRGSVILLLSGLCRAGGLQAGGVADDVREARPPEQRGARGDDEQALQVWGVVGHVGVVRAPFIDVVYDGDAGTGPGFHVGAAPAVLPDNMRAAG